MKYALLSYISLLAMLPRFAMSENIVKIGVIDLPQKLDTSNIRSANDYRIAHNLTSSLFYLGKNDRYYSYLLNNWNVNRDKNTLELFLKDDIFFSDGSPITSQDIAFTLKRQILKGTSHTKLKSKIYDGDKLHSIEQNINGIDVKDTKSLVLKFNSLTDVVFYVLTMPDLGIISKKQINKQLEITNWKISSGPYYLSKSTKKALILKPNIHHPLVQTSLQFNIIKYKDEADIVDDLVSEKIDYTFLKMFSNPDLYKKIESSPNLFISEGKVTAAQHVLFNISKKPFSDIMFRQAFYKKFIKMDLRPLKNNKYFLQANQFLFPHHLGRLTDSEINKQVEKFPDLKSQYKSTEDFQLVYAPFMLPEPIKNKFVQTLTKLGLHIKTIPYIDRDQRKRLWGKSPFYATQMFMNDKEIQQSIEYHVNLKFIFDKHQNQIADLNEQLFQEKNPQLKFTLIQKMARLFLDDATIIPMYYIVSHDFINKKFSLNYDYGYFDTPKLWNFRLANKQDVSKK